MNKQSWHSNFKRAPKEQRTGPDGFVYDSKTEMQRSHYLQMLERVGEISDFKRQPVYQLSSGAITIMAGNRIAIYTPDFIYKDKDGCEIIEDVKGYRDEASKFRIRVFEAFYGVNVRIIRKRGNRWVRE